MRIRLTHSNFTGLAASLALCALLPGVANHSYAGPLYDRGTLYRPPQTIKPPGPRVRDRGGEAKFVARRCGFHPRPCPRIVRDQRSK